MMVTKMTPICVYSCFLRHSTGVAKLDETLVSFVWFLFFYLRPVIMTVKIFPEVLLKCRKHIVVLRHERELRIDDQLFLYKDHHRRLFIVISLLVMNECMPNIKLI